MSQAQLFPTATVSIVNGSPRVSSLKVAEHFRKRHCDVLRVIQRIMSDSPKDFIERNFALNNYSDTIGRKLTAYNLTRDAFSLVVMGFTGREALAWKIRYIEAFNAMEAALKEQAAKAAPKRGRPRKALPPAREMVVCLSCNKQLLLAHDVAQVIRQVERLREQARIVNAPREFRRTAADTGRAEDRYEIQADLYGACNAALKAAAAALVASGEVGEWA